MSGDQVEAAATRAAVVVAVPSLGVVAHAHASGTVPTTGAALMLAGVGLLAALVAVPRRISARTAVVRLAAVLTSAQLGSHLLLSSMGDAAHAAHLASSNPFSMIAAHAAAIVVTAVLIPAAAALAAFASSTSRALRRRPAAVRARCGAVPFSTTTTPRPSVLAGGCGLRGPPRSQ